jgi:4-carboxymuconolactone decarboxylase
MSRLPGYSPDDLDPDRRALHEAVTTGPRAADAARLLDERGALRGPFRPMLAHPPVGAALASLGAALRAHSVLPAALREIAILTVAARWGNRFEGYVHRPAARTAGLAAATVDALDAGRTPRLDEPAQAVTLATARLLAAGDRLDDAAYAEAVAQLGIAGLVELVTIVGYYATLASLMRVFDTDEDPDDGADRPAGT